MVVSLACKCDLVACEIMHMFMACWLPTFACSCQPPHFTSGRHHLFVHFQATSRLHILSQIWCAVRTLKKHSRHNLCVALVVVVMMEVADGAAFTHRVFLVHSKG